MEYAQVKAQSDSFPASRGHSGFFYNTGLATFCDYVCSTIIFIRFWFRGEVKHAKYNVDVELCDNTFHSNLWLRMVVVCHLTLKPNKKHVKTKVLSSRKKCLLRHLRNTSVGSRACVAGNQRHAKGYNTDCEIVKVLSSLWVAL